MRHTRRERQWPQEALEQMGVEGDLNSVTCLIGTSIAKQKQLTAKQCWSRKKASLRSVLKAWWQAMHTQQNGDNLPP
jgi:hypothetical protein